MKMKKKSFLKLLRSQAKVQKIQFFFYYFLFVYPHKNQAQMIGRYGWNLTIWLTLFPQKYLAMHMNLQNSLLCM